MVAVRSAHLTPAGEFAPEKWVSSLGLNNSQSEENLSIPGNIVAIKRKRRKMVSCCYGVVSKWWRFYPL